MTNWYVVYSVPIDDPANMDYHGYEFDTGYFSSVIKKEFAVLVHALAHAMQSKRGTVPDEHIEGLKDMEYASILEIHLAIQVKYGKYVTW